MHTWSWLFGLLSFSREREKKKKKGLKNASLCQHLSDMHTLEKFHYFFLNISYDACMTLCEGSKLDAWRSQSVTLIDCQHDCIRQQK